MISEPIIPLAIPTPDGDLSVTHPSVIYAPEGWNGWPYWMAFTPYPGTDRENPCIAISQDGVSWEVPAAGSNPVVPRAEVIADGFNFNSDVCLVLRSDDTLALYYRPIYGSGNEAIYLTTSADGLSWSNGAQLLQNATDFKLISPAVVEEADGSYTMWVVDQTQSTGLRIRRRTSVDGVTWAPAVACAVPTTFAIWHIDVKRVGTSYHMLAVETGNGAFPYRLHYLRSSDGLTWTGNHEPSIPLSGLSFDSVCNYKSCFVPVPGEPLAWKMWLVGVNAADPFAAATDHRIAFYDGVRFEQGIGQASAGSDRITLAAEAFMASLGSPSSALISSRWPVWLMDANSTEGIATSLGFPSTWSKVNVYLYWTNASTGTGAVRWTITRLGISSGTGMTGGGETQTSVTATALAQNILNKTTILSGISIDSDFMWHLRINRAAADVADTLTNDAAVVALVVENAS